MKTKRIDLIRMIKFAGLLFLFVVVSIKLLVAQTNFITATETYHLNPTVDKRVELLSIVFG
jgi:hypothetical protein